MFFDGTGNNRFNSDRIYYPNLQKGNGTIKSKDIPSDYSFTKSVVEKNERKNVTVKVTDRDSYWNPYSNVAKLFDLYREVKAQTESNELGKYLILKQYVEGIGTKQDEADDFLGSGMARGSWGILKRVEEGIDKLIADQLKAVSKDKKINKIVFDVFGFSRGAAAARHFMHVASTPVTPIRIDGNKYVIVPPEIYERSDKEKETNTDNNQNIKLEDINHPLLAQHGFFGACLIKTGLNIQKIQFNFVGLYDTVASFGANHRGNWLVDDDFKQLNLNAVQQGSFIFQVASDDEFRENFSLTNINGSGIKGLQITLPGVHSDIGGGYVDGEEEKVLIYESINESQSCEKYRKILIEEGWFTDTQIYIVTEAKSHRGGATIKYKLFGKRVLSNHYDKIPLDYMFQLSKHFDTFYVEERIKNNKIEDEHILKISSQLFNYVDACQTLRNRFVIDFNSGKNISPSEYINTVDNYHYKNYKINVEDLKILRR